MPVRDFVANADCNGQYRIPPDGRKLAWQAVSGVRESLFVKSLDDDNVTVIPIKGDCLWAQDSRHLLFYRDHKGDGASTSRPLRCPDVPLSAGRTWLADWKRG